MMKRKPLGNVFSDRSSLVLRALLRQPDKKWRVSDLAQEGISFGLISEVLGKAEALGYVERAHKGRASYTQLIRKNELLQDWRKSYAFERNQQIYYFYPQKDFPKILTSVLNKSKLNYSFTLYSASRLISSYVKDDRYFIYLDLEREAFHPFLNGLETQIGLYKLVHGGNVCFALPYYKSSVFRDSRKVRGYSVVSNLQLYLDLMTFPPTGQEEAEHLINTFKKRGKSFV